MESPEAKAVREVMEQINKSYQQLTEPTEKLQFLSRVYVETKGLLRKLAREETEK